MTSPYIDVNIVNAVRHAVNSIENQHNTFSSITLSVLLSVVCGMVVEESFRHGIAILLNPITLSILIIFSIAILFVGPILIALICRFFINYGSTFTLVFDVSAFSNGWRKLFIDVLTKNDSYKYYHIYSRGCKEMECAFHGRRYEYVFCHHIYKGSIPFTIKLQLFKAANVVPLTVTIMTKPFNVIMAMYYNALQRVKLWLQKRKGCYVELSIWYEAIEDLSFYFDDVKKALSYIGIALKELVY
jgi:hypothetical protein